jgi:hypothetical protein
MNSKDWSGHSWKPPYCLRYIFRSKSVICQPFDITVRTGREIRFFCQTVDQKYGIETQLRKPGHAAGTVESCFACNKKPTQQIHPYYS